MQTRITYIVTVIASAIVWTTAPALAGSQFEFSPNASWFSGASGYVETVRVASGAATTEVSVSFTYPDGKTGSTKANRDPSDADLFHFKLPSAPDSLPGEVVYQVTAHTSGRPVESERRRIALALEMELDITGDAAIPLYYPLGGPEYTVRYVPCCNIFGGVTKATRLTINPEDNDTGLPDKRLSDFIVLQPDGLSASTMGMYFDFKLGPDRFKDVTPGLFEFDGKKWVEFKTYQVDPATGGITMHCPNGGTFVVAAKP